MRVSKGIRSSLVVLGLVVALLVGCASPAAPSPTAAPKQPAATTTAPAAAAQTSAPAPAAAPAAKATAVVPTGELRIGISAFGGGALDPMLMSITGNPYAPLIYDYIVGVTPDGKLSKDTGLATDWQASSDNLAWTFKLRKGAKFQNGEELTAEDAKFSIERAMGPKSRLGYASAMRERVQSIEVPDPYTLVVRTKYASPTIPYVLSQGLGSDEGAVVPKKYVQQIGDDDFNSRPIGSGPYRVVSFRPDTELKLEAVNEHWRIGVPKYKTLSYKIIGEPTTLVAALKKGEIDVLQGVPPTMLGDLSGFNIVAKKDAAPIAMFINQQWEDVPYKDVRVRQAMNEAIDRKAINTALLGGTATLNYLGSTGNWAVGYPKIPEIPYDANHAKQLMKDAGFADGFDITLYNIPSSAGFDLEKMAQMIVEYWRAIGIRTNITKMDYATFKPLWYARKTPKSVFLAQSTNLPLTDAYLQTTLGSKGLATSVQDPKLDAILDKLQRAATMEEYAALQAEAQLYERNNYLQVGILFGGEYFATSVALKGWEPGNRPSFPNFDALISRK